MDIKKIMWLKDLNRNSIKIAGGKGANLAEMYNAGLPIPAAFVVTTEAYKDFLEKTNLKEKIYPLLHKLDVDNTTELKEVSKEIREMISSASIPIEIRTVIVDAYKKMNIGGGRYDALDEKAMKLIGIGRDYPYVIVRSSATAEDSPGASFAGQQITFPFIKGDEPVVQAVKNCWASLFTARSIFYRTKNNFTHEKVLIAVVVQKMLDSEKAGVGFSVNPVNGEDEIIIEAGWGVGEAVVTGQINPNLYIVDKGNFAIKSKRLTEQTWMYTRDITGNKLGSIKKPLSQKKSREQVLSDKQIVDLARYIKKIEDLYNGKPQDMEWAVEEDRLYIVQTRPVTALESMKEKKGQFEEQQDESKLILTGLPASPGIASGTVKIIMYATEIEKVTKGDILVTKMTDPDFVPAMKKAIAIVTDEGGLTSHAAIVSRELGIPCIVGTEVATKKLHTGDNVVVNASKGKVYSGEPSETGESEETPKEEISEETEEIPSTEAPELEIESEKEPEHLTEDAEEINRIIEEKEKSVEPDIEEVIPPVISMLKDFEGAEKIREEASAPKVPPEETKTKIYMNLGVPEKVDDYKNLPFDGIGLMRVEFIIADNIKEHPMKMVKEGRGNEYSSKLAEGIMKVASTVYPKPVIVRFSDFKTNEYRNLEGGEEFEPQEENPMIGWRGCSRYIHPEFEKAFRLECRAITLARAKCKNIWVMLPFVRTVWEVNKIIDIMKEEKLERTSDFKIGLMAEVPSIIFMAEEFSRITDFFSIGSNDLTQLILGVDRDSSRLGKMNYFDERNAAVLRAIKYLIDTGHKFGTKVSICGQAPSVYPEFAEFLVKCGIDSISVNPDVVEQTRKLVAAMEKKVEMEKISEKEQNF